MEQDRTPTVCAKESRVGGKQGAQISGAGLPVLQTSGRHKAGTRGAGGVGARERVTIEVRSPVAILVPCKYLSTDGTERWQGRTQTTVQTSGTVLDQPTKVAGGYLAVLYLDSRCRSWGKKIRRQQRLR